jgi:hypothetical protein
MCERMDAKKQSRKENADKHCGETVLVMSIISFILAVLWEREKREREDVRERENVIVKTTPAATAGIICSNLL